MKNKTQKVLFMKKKLFNIDEKVFKDVKARYANGIYKNASDTLFLRSLLEDVQTKLNKR